MNMTDFQIVSVIIMIVSLVLTAYAAGRNDGKK